jgi:hypothetical protein
MKKKISRPSLITIICIISWAISSIYILLGLLFLTVSIILPGFIDVFLQSFEPLSIRLGLLLTIVVIPIFNIVSFYGLWKMKKWGWKFSFIGSMIFVVGLAFFDFTGFSFQAGIAYILIIFFLWINRKLLSRK